MKANRNDSCPCGSGKKFKKCCEGKSAFASSSLAKRSGIIAAASILVAAGAVAAWLNRAPSPEAGLQSGMVSGAPAAGAPAGQPPGPAPLGKVWSAEHGHWHDAPRSRTVTTGVPNPIKIETSTAPLSAGSGMAPPMAFTQPNQPAPPGKVWSAAHGHWHDAPAGAMIDATQAVPQRRTTAQPPGPAPAGKVWSAEHGHWHNVQ